jgi:signal transduction histidine kinase
VTVYGIAQTDMGSIWMATDLGLFRYDLATGKMQKKEIPVRSGSVSKDQIPFISTAVTALTAQDSILYLGIEDQLIGYEVSTGKITLQLTLLPNIQFIRGDANGVLWVGMWISGLFRVDPKLKSVRHFVAGDHPNGQLKTNGLISGNSIGEKLWLGYNGGHGFASMDINTFALEHYMPLINGKTTYAQGTINALAVAGDHVWLGTYGDGLIDYDLSSQTCTLYQQGDGLSGNYVHHLLLDAHQRLWISTADGLCLFDPISRRVQALDITSAFPDIEYVESGCMGVNGNLCFFDREKILVIDPLAYRFDTSFARVVVSRFSVFDQDMSMPPESEPIRLRHNQHFFSFTFSAIKSRPDKKTEYGYMLDGFDPKWVETTSPIAGYTNVPPGRYVFMIRIANDAGVWSEPLWRREIIIVPPFWKTAWFAALVILGLASLLYALHRYRIMQLKKIYSIRTQISRDLHDDIGASLSSIHIYSSIAEEEIKQDPEKAKTFLQQINASSRQVMEDISDIVWANRLQHEHHASLDARIKNYGYDLLSQKNIACTYRIDPQAEQQVTKPEARRNVLLIIKEALNNMAKYSDATHAEIELFLNGNNLSLRISDNGCGFDPEKRNGGNGLEHMQKRTEALNGSLTITSKPGNGTIVQCQIPVTKISDK